TRPTPRVRHALAERGAVVERGRRPPRTCRSRHNAHLCQGQRACTAHRRRFQSGGPVMNINDLVTRYVAFRRTLGDQYLITEKTLRSFCPRHRSANASLPDSAQDGSCVPGWHRPHHPVVALQAYRAQGLVPIRGQPWPPEEGPPTNGSTETPTYTCPVHLLNCRDSPPTGCDSVFSE